MKSELLSYVLTKAEGLQKEVGFAELTATHFLSATLLVLDEIEREECPLDVDAAKDELAAVTAALGDIVPDNFAAAARALAKSVEESSYDKKKDGNAYATAAAAIAIGEMFGGDGKETLAEYLTHLLTADPLGLKARLATAALAKGEEGDKAADDGDFDLGEIEAIIDSILADADGDGKPDGLTPAPAADAPADDAPAADGEWHVVDRPARAGDTIRLKTDGNFSFNRPGDILRVHRVENGLAKVRAADHPRPTGQDDDYEWNYRDDEYEVVEGGTAPAAAPAADAPAEGKKASGGMSIDELVAQISGATEKKAGAKADGKATTEGESDIDRILASLGGSSEGGDAPAEDAAPAEEVMTPETSATALSSLVGQTRELQKTLLSKVVGQDHAVRAFVAGYFQARLVAATGQDNKRSQATFLFAGPPGVGKTFLAETAAEALGLPFCRFDMSEYSDHQAGQTFCGNDRGFSNSHPGNVTSFVAKHKKCVLLFDEIEKAHLNVIYLFLQILDAGRLRDNYTEKEVSFADTVMIFTTNVGKQLYEDSSIANLGALPRKKILQAIANEVNPATKAPRFPGAICSRFASGNVLMFNHLGAANLHFVAKREMKKHMEAFATTTGIEVTLDERVPSALIFAEGGRADARTVRGRSATMFHDEIYELLRLMGNEDATAVAALKRIEFSVALDGDPEIARMFDNPEKDKVLVFAEPKTVAAVTKKLKGAVCLGTESLEEARELIYNNDFSILLCDVRTGVRAGDGEVLNAEDILSEGQDFLHYVRERVSVPVYLLEKSEGEISREELLSFGQMGVSDLLTLTDESFAATVVEKCKAAYQQENILRLAKSNKILSYKTKQTVSRDGKTAKVQLFNFRLTVAPDVEESGSLLDAVSRPTVRFADVIGAEEAKDELGYFVKYLKNPTAFLRQGLRPPKGVLLWGPPGTGKTMLAKAMAGESDVTFMVAEGNQFLKRYVGEGPDAVHNLFRTARKYAPTIIFIDEIDAMARNRNEQEGSVGTGDVLTALLAEMDGFKNDETKPIFVLAATNYEVDGDGSSGRTLDPALLRRFDRRIFIGLPKKEERLRFMEMKLRANPAIVLSPEQVENIAVRSTGMSLAELDSVFELALRGAVRTADGKVGDAMFEEAFETFNYGAARPETNQEELLSTARHEAGHALLCWMNGECPSYLTIVARGGHGGYMQHADTEGKGCYTRAELLFRIRTSLAGRAAEMAYYGPEKGLTTGASSDLAHATHVAQRIIGTYGMDEAMGLSVLEPGNIALAADLRRRTNEILAGELALAITTINENREAMDAIVAELMAKNYLKGEEIDEIFARYIKK